MEFTEVAHALSSRTRVRLMQIVLDSPVSSAEAFQRYQSQYDTPSHRESIYRELENLAETGLLEKRYESEEKELVYVARDDTVCLDMREMVVSMGDD